MLRLFLNHCLEPVSLDDSLTFPPSQKDKGPRAVISGVICCPDSTNLTATTLLLLLSRLFPPAIMLLPCKATPVAPSYDPDCPILKNAVPFPLKLVAGKPLLIKPLGLPLTLNTILPSVCNTIDITHISVNEPVTMTCTP